MDGDFLSEDFCVLDGKHFMIRCVLSLLLILIGGATASRVENPLRFLLPPHHHQRRRQSGGA